MTENAKEAGMLRYAWHEDDDFEIDDQTPFSGLGASHETV